MGAFLDRILDGEVSVEYQPQVKDGAVLSEEDNVAIDNLSAQLKVPRAWVEKLVANESSWDPGARNETSGARGLIQFLHSTAKGLGYSNADDLVKKHPTRKSQLEGPVLKYLSQHAPFKDEGDFYLSVFNPASRGRPRNESFSPEVRKSNPQYRTINDFIRKYIGSNPGTPKSSTVESESNIPFWERFVFGEPEKTNLVEKQQENAPQKPAVEPKKDGVDLLKELYPDGKIPFDQNAQFPQPEIEDGNPSPRYAKAWGRSVAGMERGIGGAMEVAADIADKLPPYMGGSMAETLRLWKPVAEGIKKDAEDLSLVYKVDDPEFVDKLAEGISSGLQFLVPSMGVARGAAVVGMLGNTAKAAKIASWLGIGVNAAVEAATEAGNTYADLQEKGVPEDEAIARAISSYGANLALITATDFAGGLFARKAGKAAKTALADRIRRQATELGKEMLSEGLQETGQESIGMVAGKEEFDVGRAVEAGGMGALTAGIMHGMTTASDRVGDLRGKRSPAAEPGTLESMRTGEYAETQPIPPDQGIEQGQAQPQSPPPSGPDQPQGPSAQPPAAPQVTYWDKLKQDANSGDAEARQRTIKLLQRLQAKKTMPPVGRRQLPDNTEPGPDESGADITDMLNQDLADTYPDEINEFFGRSAEEVEAITAHDSEEDISKYPENLRDVIIGMRADNYESEAIQDQMIKIQELEDQIQTGQSLLDAIKPLYRSIDPKSFGDAFDPNAMREFAHLLKQGGQPVDQARFDFISKNRDRLADWGISEDQLQTTNEFMNFIANAPTQADIENLKKQYKQIDNDQYIASARAQYENEQRAKYQPGYKPAEDSAPAQPSPAKKQKFSSETGDLFEGTDFAAPPPPTPGQTAVDEEMRKREEVHKAKQRENAFEGTQFDETVQGQDDLFQAGGKNASVGRYAQRGKGARRIQLPEIVEIAKKLMGGKLPKLMKKLRVAGGAALGAAAGRRMWLRQDIFEDIEQAEKIIAHEIGHINDYMGKEGDTDARGNIVGRIGSLKNYMKRWLAGYPGGPGELTDADYKRLKEIARKQLSRTYEKEIDEEIITKIKAKPEDILAIWNSTTANIDKDLYEYIARLSTADKKSIVLEAMKGRVSDKVPSKTERKTVRKTVTVNEVGDPAAFAARYGELVQNEIKKRRLLDAKQIRQELIDVGVIWKHFDPTNKFSEYTKYRLRPEELYADAISILLNEPKLLAEKAPNFYRGFMAYLDQKPEFKKVWEEIQDAIDAGPDEIGRRRMEKELEGQRQGTEKALQIAEERRKPKGSMREELAIDYFDRQWVFLREVSKIMADGGSLKEGENPIMLQEERAMLTSRIAAYLKDVVDKVIAPNNIDKSKLGLFLAARRNSTELQDKAAPGGLQGEYARDQLSYYKRLWGKEEYSKIEEAAKVLWALRQEHIIPRLEESGAYSDELMDFVTDNENYATRNIVKYMEKHYGPNGVAGAIHKLKGTFEAQSNAFFATVLKDAYLLRVAHENMTKRASVEILKQHPNESMRPVKVESKFDGKTWHTKTQPENAELKTIKFMHKGKVEAYDLPRKMAEAIENHPNQASKFATNFSFISRFFKNVFVRYNPYWMVRNIVKDYFTTWFNIPRSDIVSVTKAYAKTMRTVGRYVFHDIQSDLIKEMQKRAEIYTQRITAKSDLVSAEDELDLQFISWGTNPALYDRKVVKPMQRLLDYLNLEKIGTFTELWGKAAGHVLVEEKYKDKPVQERAGLVRDRVSTPNAQRRGAKHTLYNGILMFSNITKEGWRGSFDSAKEDPKKFLFRATTGLVAPEVAIKIIETGILIGLLKSISPELADIFGWWKRMFDAIPESDKTFYHCIPLYEDKNGKPVYLPIPRAHHDALIGGLTRKALNLGFNMKGFKAKELLNFFLAQLPSSNLNPAIETPIKAVELLLGNNPEDPFTMRDIVPKDEFNAGLKYSIPKFLEWSVGQMGGSVWFKFDGDDPAEGLEKIYGLPKAFTNAALRTFIRSSDRGLEDKTRDKTQDINQKSAVKSIKVEDEIRNHINNNLGKVDMAKAKPLYDKLKKEGLYSGEWGRFRARYRAIAVEESGIRDLKRIQRAGSKEKREIVVEEILNKEGLTGLERKARKRVLMRTSTLYKEANRAGD